MKPTEDNKRVVLPNGQEGYWTGETSPDGEFYEIRTPDQDVGGLGKMYHHIELESPD